MVPWAACLADFVENCFVSAFSATVGCILYYLTDFF